MSHQQRYPYRGSRRDEEEERFIDRVKDWFGGREDRQPSARDRARVYENRDRDYNRDYNYNYNRERGRPSSDRRPSADRYSGYGYSFDRNLNRDYDREQEFYRSQAGRQGDWDDYEGRDDYRPGEYRSGDYGRGEYRSGDYRRGDYRPGDYRRDFRREQDYAQNRDYDRSSYADFNRDADYRSRDRDSYGSWNRDADYRRGSYGDRNRNEEYRYRDQYSDLNRNTESQRRGQYNDPYRDTESQRRGQYNDPYRDTESQRRGQYNDPYRDTESQRRDRGQYSDLNRDAESRDRFEDPYAGRYSGGYGDPSYPNRPYPTAGMRSDYGGQGYRENDPADLWDEDEAAGYADYVGYDSEGAFYQDLDNPYTSDYWEVWMVPGDFTGLGPQNYTRSDERIQEEVCERLTRHGWIDAGDIDVSVEGGAVALRGSVPNREMKRLAEDIVEDISGVSDVRNEIKVRKDTRPPAQHRGEQPLDQAYQWAGRGRFDDQSTSRADLRPGMEVIDQSGRVIGVVKEVRDGDFLVDREMARDVYIPRDQVRSVGAQVMIDVAKEEVDQQDWEKPNIL